MAAQGGWNERVWLVIDRWLDMANSYAQFDGSTGFITVPDDDALDLGTGDFTICGVVPKESSGYILFKILAADYPDGTGYYIAVTSTTISLYMIDFNPETGKTGLVVSKSRVGVSTPFFFSVSIDRDGVGIMYVNAVAGTPKDVSSFVAVNLSNSYNLEIGMGVHTFAIPPAQYFSGSLDDLRIYKAELNATDIATIYNNGNGIKYAAGQCSADASYVLDFDNNYIDLVGSLEGTPTIGVELINGGVPLPVVTYADRSNAPGGLAQSIKSQSMATRHRKW